MHGGSMLHDPATFCSTRSLIDTPTATALRSPHRLRSRATATRMTLTVTKLKGLGFRGTVYKFSPGTKFGWHTHGQDKKDSILTGKFCFKNREEEVVLSPGDMLDVPKGMEHFAETIGNEAVTFVDATRF